MYEDIMTEEQFTKIHKLDPESNKTQLFGYLIKTFEAKRVDFADNPIDYNFIHQRYSEYCGWWKRKHGAKDPKFLSSKDRKVSLIKFITESMYDAEWGMGKNPRDFYMLGDMSFIELKDKVEMFRELISKRNPNLINQCRKYFKQDGKTTIPKETKPEDAEF